MTPIEELILWLKVVEHCSVPQYGTVLTEQEKSALAQSCSVLALTAQRAAESLNS